MPRSSILTANSGRSEVRLPKAKWVRCTRASDPLSRVAKRALRSRLKLVAFYAPLAAHQARSHIEYVHQLRVVTRRAAAALDTFEALVPRRPARKLRRMLRRLRRAAGDARDLDVLGTRLAQEGVLSGRASSRVIEMIARRRDKAQKRLVRAHQWAKQKEYKQRTRVLLKRVGWRCDDREPTLGEAAPELLRASADGFWGCVVTGRPEIEALHQMRIAVKRLRYSIELLAGGCAIELQRDVYPTVEELAAKLGQLNDHATARDLLEGWQRKQPELCQLTTLAAYEAEQLDASYRSLTQWWTPARASELEERLRASLTQRTD